MQDRNVIMTREEQIKQDQESIYQGGFEPTVNTGV